jgi:hypothetical protein
MTFEQTVEKLDEEIAELRAEIALMRSGDGNARRLVAECVDVANCAMIIADNLGGEA